MRLPKQITFALFTFLCGILSFNYIQAREYANVQVRFSAITLSGTINDLQFVNGSNVETFDIYKGQRSDKFRYNGPAELYFYRESGGKISSNGEVARTPIGKVIFPTTSQDYLLVFVPISGEKDRYEISLIPDDLSTFKPGMYRFINTAPFDVALKLGETKNLLRKRNYTDVLSVGKESEYQEAIMFSLVENEKPLRSFKGGLYFTEKKRNIYIIASKAGGRPGRIKFTVIPEQIEGSSTQ